MWTASNLSNAVLYLENIRCTGMVEVHKSDRARGDGNDMGCLGRSSMMQARSACIPLVTHCYAHSVL